jgi:hypothetical protein
MIVIDDHCEWFAGNAVIFFVLNYRDGRVALIVENPKR